MFSCLSHAVVFLTTSAPDISTNSQSWKQVFFLCQPICSCITCGPFFFPVMSTVIMQKLAWGEQAEGEVVLIRGNIIPDHTGNLKVGVYFTSSPLVLTMLQTLGVHSFPSKVWCLQKGDLSLLLVRSLHSFMLKACDSIAGTTWHLVHFLLRIRCGLFYLQSLTPKILTIPLWKIAGDCLRTPQKGSWVQP